MDELRKLDRIERQELKDLARLHNWNEIEKKFGSGWRRKAQAWLKKKLSEEGANEEQGGANNNATPQVSAQPKPLITPEGKDDDHPQIERTQDADAGENKDISDIVRKIDMEKEVSEQPVASEKVKKPRISIEKSKKLPKDPSANFIDPTKKSGDGERKEKQGKSMIPRAPSAYILFCKDNRNQVRDANPSLSFTELGQKLGELWRQCAAEEKAKYEGEAVRKKIELQKSLLEKGIHTPNIKEGKKKSSGEKKDKLPKKEKKAENEPKEQVNSEKIKKKKDANKEKGPDDSGDEDDDASEGADKSNKKGKRLLDVEDMFLIQDPRARAMEIAEKRRKAGVAARVNKEGVIVIPPPAAGASATPGSHLLNQDPNKNRDAQHLEGWCMPKLTGRMNYIDLDVKKDMRVGLVLPALIDWKAELQTVLNEVETNTVPEDVDKSYWQQVDVARTMVEVQKKNLISPLAHLASIVRNGVLFGKVLEVCPVDSSGNRLDAETDSEQASKTTEKIDKSLILSRRVSTFQMTQIIHNLTSESRNGSKNKGTSVQTRQKHRVLHLVRIALCKAASLAGGFAEDKYAESEDEITESDYANGNDEAQMNESVVGMETSGRRHIEAINRAREEKGKRMAEALQRETFDWEEIVVPWLSPRHPAVGSPHIIPSWMHEESLKLDLRPGTQVRMMFALPEDPSRGEWSEGRVYYTGTRQQDKLRGWANCRYKSHRVVWYDQDGDTQVWHPELDQVENEVSPWELKVGQSPFIRPGLEHAFCIETPALDNPRHVVEYLSTTEPASFLTLPNRKREPDYYNRISNPIDLSIIARKAEEGAYDENETDGASGTESTTLSQASDVSSRRTGGKTAGITVLWEDLRLLIRNAKTYNPSTSMYWRLADALEVEIRRVKKAYKGPQPKPRYSGTKRMRMSSDGTVRSMQSNSNQLAPLTPADSQEIEMSLSEKEIETRNGNSQVPSSPIHFGKADPFDSQDLILGEGQERGDWSLQQLGEQANGIRTTSIPSILENRMHKISIARELRGTVPVNLDAADFEDTNDMVHIEGDESDASSIYIANGVD